MRIPVYKNNKLVKFSVVDDDRTDLLKHNYYLDTSGYVRRSVRISKEKMVDRYLHHDVLKTDIGSENLFYVCDHINGNPLDNRRKNLRMCSASQNNYNKRSTTGISFHKQSGKYEATLTRNRKKLFLGLYKSEQVARNAYKFAKPIVANDKYASIRTSQVQRQRTTG